MIDRIKNQKRRVARRQVLPGFPVNIPFVCIDDVRKYLSGDYVVCLLCGKKMKKLGQHISLIHNLTPDEYREKYNIPWTYSLAGKATQDSYGASMKKRIQEGFVPGGDHHENLVAMMHASKKRKEVFKRQISIRNLNMKTRKNKNVAVDCLFDQSRLEGTPLVTVTTRAKYADVTWDYIAYHPQVDPALDAVSDQIMAGALEIFNRYAVEGKSECSWIPGRVVFFRNIKKADAQSAAQDLRALIKGVLS